MDDFIFDNPVMITSPVNVDGITKSNFVLTWETDVDASAEVRYGSTTSPSQWIAFAKGSTTTENDKFIHEVIDNNKPEFDPIVITGSHNWSTRANTINDENTLIIHNEEIANQFYQNFSARFKANNGTIATCLKSPRQIELKVYPNPVSDRLRIVSPKKIMNVTLFTISGMKVIKKQQINTSVADVNLVQLKPGVYFLKVKTDGGIFNTVKIIKK